MRTLPNTTSPAKETDALQSWRELFFSKTIKIVGIAGSIVYIAYLMSNYKTLLQGPFWVYSIAFLLLITAAFFPRIPAIYRTYIFILTIFGVGIASSVEFAAIGDSRLWFLLATLLAVVFLGRKTGLFFVFLVTFSFAILGYLFANSILIQPEVDQFSFSFWTSITITLLVVGFITVLIVDALSARLNKDAKENALLAQKTELQNRELEKQRNTLEQRTKTLEASAKVIRQLTSSIVYQDILAQLPKLLREEFYLNSAAVFLFDEENALRLESYSGWNEQARPARDYVLSAYIDTVGLAIADRKAYSNIDSELELKIALEETRSYVAIPLLGNKDVIGALVLQSTKANTFNEGKVSILQMLANHIMILLENVKLLAEKESVLEAERRAYGNITQKAWQNFLNEQNYGGYQRDKNGLTLVPAKPYHPQEKQEEVELVPLTIRGKVIAHIDAHKAKNRTWTASEKELLHILATRLETAIDGARLYQDAQQRAEDQQAYNKAATKIGESLDIKSVLKTAALELRNTLDIAEAEVWISAEDMLKTDKSNKPDKESPHA